MKKILLTTLIIGVLLGTFSKAQNTYTIYDKIVFYNGYHDIVDEPAPIGVTRVKNSLYTTKLSDELVNTLALGGLTMDVTIGALCDNYDRLGHVYLAFVDKGATSYEQDQVNHIEIGRIITPFMDKNKTPTEVPFHFRLDNVSEVFKDQNILNDYDIWVEFEVFGVSSAANTQVSGCADRNDVFEGTLAFTVEESNINYTESNTLIPLLSKVRLNNYNATDVEGETTKIVNFTLDEPLNNAILYLITSNHGANSGGEEYERRWHFVYLDDTLIHSYIPGGKSCEPYRQYNTQGNGIYGQNQKTTRQWLSFNNWCPGDVIPNREVSLGNLTAGEHTLKLDVPDAVFVGEQGNFPTSMYIQNRQSGQVICDDPTDLEITEQVGNTVTFDWTENGDATQWEVMYGRKALYSDENFLDDNDGETGFQLTDLTNYFFYEIYVRAICGEDFTSNWVGPIPTERILSINENEISKNTIYPNPAHDFININSKSSVKQVEIYNAGGKKVLSTKSSKINITLLPVGVYMVNVTFEDGKQMINKVVKQ